MPLKKANPKASESANKPGLVYFLRSEKYIKIGHTTQISTRWESHRHTTAKIYGSLTFIGCMPGSKRIEKGMHSRFARVAPRIRSTEWFEITRAALDLIETLRPQLLTFSEAKALDPMVIMRLKMTRGQRCRMKQSCASHDMTPQEAIVEALIDWLQAQGREVSA